MTDKDAPPIDATRTLVRGAAWGVFMRWSIKLLGLLSTMLLARLLTPNDYGIVAMAMLVVGFLEVFTDFGVETGLIRMNKANRDDIDSAWSLRLLQGIVLAALLVLIAPFAGQYFKEPRVVWVIWIISIGALISGFNNIGITLARMELNFGLDFRYHVVAKLLSTAITIGAAFLIRDYRALVIGLVSGYVGSCALSYVMHPYRPKWNTSRVHDMWAFGKWMLVSGIGNFATRRMDELVASRITDAHGLGIYNVGADIGQLPTSEVGLPLMRALMPTLSAIQEDRTKVRSVVLKTLASVNTLTLALGFGLAAVATPATLVLLGEQWTDAADIVAIFAIVGALKISVGPLPSLMLLNGLGRLHARIMWLEFTAFALAAALLVPQHSLMGLAYARLVSAGAYVLIYMFSAQTYADIKLGEILSTVWRAAVGVALMLVVIHAADIEGHGALLDLLAQVCLGVLIYVGWITLSWICAGKPDGIETIALQFLRNRLKSNF